MYPFYAVFAHLILAVVFLSSLFCIAHAETVNKADSKYGGEYRAPLGLEPATLDPARYSDIYSMQVATNLFDGLVEFDQNLNVVPAIARRWKISRDHLTYTFYLREGVKFHNGREVTAEDFVYSFHRLLDPDIKSPAASLFLYIQGAKDYNDGTASNIKGLTTSSPSVLNIQLEEPFAPFLSILAMINAKVVPEEAVNEDFAKKPIGTGPFRFDSWQADQEITLIANESYFAEKPFLEKLRFRIYPKLNLEQMYLDYQAALLEHTEIPGDRYDQIMAGAAADDSSIIISKPGLNLAYLGINHKVKPFNDVTVRQAISYAVDTELVVREFIKKGSRPAQGILPPGIAGFNPEFRGYTHNPDKARELLAQAGYPAGKEFPTISIWTLSTSARIHQQLQVYQQHLTEVGLQSVIEVAESWQALLKAVEDNRANMFFVGWYADYPDADNFFYPLFHSQSNYALSISVPPADQMINQARTETDYQKRAELYRDIEKLIMDYAPIIPQHNNSNNYIFHSRLQGIEMGFLGITYFPYRKVWFAE